MKPAQTYNIFSTYPAQNGYYILTFPTTPRYDKITKQGINPPHEIPASDFIEWRKRSMKQADVIKRTAQEILRDGCTIWKPAHELASAQTYKTLPPIGELVAYDETNQYQNTKATAGIYKVKGYAPLIVVWFNNETGERIA